MKPQTGLTDKDRQGICALLETLLADETVLYIKTRNYHWNVTGPNFSELHKLFESQYDALAENIDEIAERIRALGEFAPGTLKEYLNAARLKETPGKHPAAKVMISDLLKDHEAVAKVLRKDLAACAEDFHDAGTSDFLTGLLEQHEKTAWMLRAYL